jgi:hypothetical protein
MTEDSFYKKFFEYTEKATKLCCLCREEGPPNDYGRGWEHSGKHDYVKVECNSSHIWSELLSNYPRQTRNVMGEHND